MTQLNSLIFFNKKLFPQYLQIIEKTLITKLFRNELQSRYARMSRFGSIFIFIVQSSLWKDVEVNG